MFVRKSGYIDLVGARMVELCRTTDQRSILGHSSCASMRMLADLSLSYLVFVDQLTDVVNVTMRLSNVAVLDNCESAYINGVK